MNVEYLDKNSDKFDEIVQDIKQRNLSRNNMPKLIVGTGLSIIYGVPGMSALTEELNTKIDNSNNTELISMWKNHYESIRENGLEKGLSNITQDENILVDEIKTITAKFILESEEKIHCSILGKDTGFSKLLKYLSETVSVSKKIIDIMTPNYDRIIEIICDKLGIGVITGFTGSLYCSFDKNILKKPTDVYNCKDSTWVRLFKPHGSINWINEDGKTYLSNDYEVLNNKSELIEIVTPGSSKYKVTMTNNTFRYMREDFNELLNNENNYSLIIDKDIILEVKNTRSPFLKKNGYIETYEVSLNKEVTLYPHQDTIISFEYISRVSDGDMSSGVGVSVLCKKFSLNFYAPPEYTVHAHSFGFLDSGDNSSNSDYPNNISVRFDKWLLPYEGVVICVSPNDNDVAQLEVAVTDENDLLLNTKVQSTN